MGYCFGFDVPNYLVNLYLNTNQNYEKFSGFSDKKYAYQLFYSDQIKPFKGITLPEELKKLVLDLIVFKKPGDNVGPFTSLFDRAGVALLQFNNAQEYILYQENLRLFKL